MFYSETLLSKTGPLARVWLSANLERKLSKTHILQSNIETSVGAIVGQDQAPMALRLSGQLLLGVVRIYSRKARYLLEDCNEALMKIKMAFRPGNVDLPPGATSHSATQLTLPDVITELDLLLPDPTLDLGDLGQLPLGSDAHISSDAVITLPGEFLLGPEHGLTSSGLARDDDLLRLEDDDLFLDGLEPEEPTPKPMRATRGVGEGPLSEVDFSPEIGRREMPPLDEGELDITMDGMEFPGSPKRPESETGRNESPPYDYDTTMGFPEEEVGLGGEVGPDDFSILEQHGLGLGSVGPETPRAQSVARAVSSPLSSVRSSVEREDAELWSHVGLGTNYIEETPRPVSEEPEPEAVHHQRAVRGRKVMIDEVTEIRAKQIKAQQEDRSRILKEPSFLPRDPTLLALLSLQKSRGFAQNVFYPKNIAPELASLLSPEFVRRMAELKRKRDDEEEEEVVGEEARSPTKHPKFEAETPVPMEDEEERAASGDEGGAEEMFTFPEDDTLRVEEEGEEEGIEQLANIEPGPMTPGIHMGADEQGFTPGPEEESHMPPASTQPISKQTQAAVHLLRDQFSEPIGKKSVKFQELLPHATTARTDATKMFFEVLVLATKDAISVKQTEGFGDILIKGKKALWGQWAEERDEQQVMEEEEKERDLKLQGGEGVQQRELVVGVGRGESASAAAA